MKTNLAVPFATFLVFMTACTTGRKIPATSTIERMGVVYKIHATEPLTGTTLTYHLNGRSERRTEYRDGIKHGKEEEWFKDGNKSSLANWQNGIRHGEQTEWYENGKKSFQGNMAEGKWIGECRGWYPDGQEAFRISFLDGKGRGNPIEIRWNNDNLIRTFPDVKVDGEWIEWHPSGRITRHEKWLDGELVQKIL